VRADEGPWTDDPAGPAWDACAWVPAAEKGEFWRFDWRAVRETPTPWRMTSAWHDGVAVRRTWVRTLGLPEEALGDVIAVDEPVRYQACQPRISEAEVVSGLVAKGFVELALAEGARGFRWPDGDRAFVAIVDGRLILGGDDETFRQILDVRRGRAKSLQTAPGVRAACAAGPKGLPVQVEAGRSLRRRGPSDPPAPLVVVSATSGGARTREVHAIECESEEARDQVRRMLERMVVLRPDANAGDVFTVGVRGTGMRFTVEGDTRDNVSQLRRAAQVDLEALGAALTAFRERHGTFPTAAQGLGGLRAEPESLDALLGAVPNDPWGAAYAYQPGHAKRPDGFVLRSLGPDGEIDTEDDVLPDTKDR
jgi:hypothetical protein